MKNTIQLPSALLPGQGYTLKVETVGWADGGGWRGGRGGRGRGGGGWRGGGGGRGGRGGQRGHGGVSKPDKRKCFRCRERGHLAANCRYTDEEAAAKQTAAQEKRAAAAAASVPSSIDATPTHLKPPFAGHTPGMKIPASPATPAEIAAPMQH